jgi:hypothetical protein
VTIQLFDLQPPAFEVPAWSTTSGAVVSPMYLKVARLVSDH